MTAISRPDGASTRHTSRSSAFRIVGHFQRMDEQDAIDRGIRQRQREFIDQRRQRRPRGRPFQHALRRRHEGDAAFGVLAEQAEIGRRIAEPEHPLARAFGQRAWMPRLISRRATMPRRCE